MRLQVIRCVWAGFILVAATAKSSKSKNRTKRLEKYLDAEQRSKHRDKLWKSLKKDLKNAGVQRSNICNKYRTMVAQDGVESALPLRREGDEKLGEKKTEESLHSEDQNFWERLLQTSTIEMSMFPTIGPSELRSTTFSEHPSASPSVPSVDPVPSMSPSTFSSLVSSANPSSLPTEEPSGVPSKIFSIPPAATPSIAASTVPSALSSVPSRVPIETLPPTLVLVASTPPTATQPLRTSAPSSDETTLPTLVPVASAGPSAIPTSSTTLVPTRLPTESRPPLPLVTDTPTSIPTTLPTRDPIDTDFPTSMPTGRPTAIPTSLTTLVPTQIPTELLPPFPAVTASPTSIPTRLSTRAPKDTEFPTSSPTDSPKIAVPTRVPTRFPTRVPTETATPTPPATDSPSALPTPRPTPPPSALPTPIPSPLPTSGPSPPPTSVPTTTPVVVTPPPTFSPTPLPTPLPTALPTVATPVSRVRDVVFPVAIFGGQEFENATSHQSKALSWLEGTDVSSLNNERIIQRYALSSIYFATFNVSTVYTRLELGEFITGWARSAGWLSETNECDWASIACDDNNNVRILDLFGNLVTGEFPPEVVLMADTLEILDLGRNFVFTEGETFNPYLGMLTNLIDLRYDDTNFINVAGIPTEIGNLKQLQYYSCSAVRYAGALNGAAFPPDLTQLTLLEIGFNSFDTTFPLAIGNLPNLTFFYARDAGARGNIDFMRNMGVIREAWLSANNGLVGTLPTFIGTLSTLESFKLEGTGFTGTIPTEWAQIVSLDRLEIGLNTLDGLLPTEICDSPPTIMRADCVNCPSGCCSTCFDANGSEVPAP